MKRCKQCGELKPASEFCREPNGKDGLKGSCKACCKVARRAWYVRNRPAVMAKVQRWNRANLERVSALRRHRGRYPLQLRLHLQRKYGMTLEDYDNMLAAQHGGCAICGDRPVDGRSMHVDHKGDAVRGILCVCCNDALGQFKDDPELILRGAEYLRLGGFAPLDLVRREFELKRKPDNS
jgi:hypothetical protein